MTSHSPHRYPPYSRSPLPSPRPFEQRRLPLPGHHDYLSPASTRHPSPHPTTNSAPRDPGVPPFLNVPHTSTPQPFEDSMYRGHSMMQQPVNAIPQGHSSRPPTKDSDEDPPSFILLYPPPSPRFLYAADESVVICTPEMSNSTEQRPFQFSQGTTSTSSLQRQRDASPRYQDRAILSRFYVSPHSPEQSSTSQLSYLPQNDAGRPTEYTEKQVPAASTSSHPSVSNVSIFSTTKSVSARPSLTPEGFQNPSYPVLSPPGFYTFPDSTEQPSHRQPYLHSPAYLRENDGESTDVAPHYIENQVPAVSTSRHQPNVSTYPPANFISSHSISIPETSTHEVGAYQNDSSLLLAPPSLTSLPRRQVSTYRGDNHPHHSSQGTFSNAQNFVVKDSVFIDHNITTDDFMKHFLQHTIIGAEFDSSARDPPPRCHPGTRLAILQRCLDFIVECSGQGKLRWVVGPAGVGKSAVMQIVAEKAPGSVIVASVFLSINGRRDGTKAIVTIAYQLAVKCGPYRQFIWDEIRLDPSLLEKSLSVQFNKFIVEPFIRRHLFDSQRRFLMVIDGLDECDNPITQQKLLELISDFCIRYPSSPIAWIIASRPEPHITSFFERVEVQPAFTMEEIQVDSDEAYQEVQRYLRAELKEIKLAYPSLKRKPEWPSALEFTKIASAAGGLFAYASTVIRYIGDPHYRDPTAKLRHVLEAIDAGPTHDNSGRDHPMALLDALYARIFSNIPGDVMVNTRRLLLLHSGFGGVQGTFRWQCNFLGLTEDAAYGAISHLLSVFKVPAPDRADHEYVQCYHKSFEDFLFDFKRSGFSQNIRDEAEELVAQACVRVVEEVLDDPYQFVRYDSIQFGGGNDSHNIGSLQGCPGSCDNISLSWPANSLPQTTKMTDNRLRYCLYCDSMDVICTQFQSRFYGSMFHFHALTTRFTSLGPLFPVLKLRTSVFCQFRHELKEIGKLKQVPLRVLSYAAICGDIDACFFSPIQTNVRFSDRWNPSCDHNQQILSGGRHWQGWSTRFRRFDENRIPETDIPHFNSFAVKTCHRRCLMRDPILFDQAVDCHHCLERFARHFNNNADRLANIFIDATELCYVEFSCVDPDDGVSEWTYQFTHSGLPTSTGE